MQQENTHTFTVEDNESNIRADIAISRHFSEILNRSTLKKDLQWLKINDVLSKISTVVKSGDDLVFSILKAPAFEKVEPEDIPLDIVYEDESILVINKPIGMTVHPAAGHFSGTLVNALLYHCSNLPQLDELRPGIVHRLDKDTSGLMVCVKTQKALTVLSNDFKDRKIIKKYQAIVKGRLSLRAGLIETPIGRMPSNRKKFTVTENGKPSKTGYKVLKEYYDYSLLEIDLYTGRTHQIRVHLSSINHPVAGDPIYSRRNPMTDKLCLASVFLSFKHPESGEEMEFTLPLPTHMNNLLEKLNSTFL